MTSEMIWNIVKNDIIINQRIIQAFLLLLRSPGFNPFEINPAEGMSLLHRASLDGKTEIVRSILLPSQFSIWEIKELVDNQCNLHQSTALNYACFGGHPEIFKLLIEAGASIYSRDKHRNTPLHLAMKNAQTDIVSELIRISGNNPDYLNAQDAVNESTALHWASIIGNVAVVRMLIASGAQIDILDRYGNTPLQDAAVHGKAEAYWTLIIAGSLFRNSDMALILCKGLLNNFIEEGFTQLSLVSKLLETLPSTNENEIIFIVLSRILYTFSQILIPAGMTNSPPIITRLHSILNGRIIVSWLNAMLTRWELELIQIKSSVSFNSSITPEGFESLLNRLKNLDIGLTNFNDSLELLPALSNRLLLKTIIFSLRLRRSYLNRQISEIKDRLSPSRLSSSSVQSIGTAISTSHSSIGSNPMRQSASEKRGRMYASQDLRPLKIMPAPWNSRS
jgi:ankyrin repeat protein